MRCAILFIVGLTALAFWLESAVAPVSAKTRMHPEDWYVKHWCAIQGGQADHVIEDGTEVDCLTDTMAVEFDFASKHYECGGQAKHYARVTHRLPVCVLIVEDPAKDFIHVRRGMANKIYWQEPYTIMVVFPEDFYE